MRLPCLRLLMWCSILLASVAVSVAADPEAHAPGQRTWKSQLDWYGSNALIAKLAPSVQQSELRVQIGDDPRWAEIGWDDSAWTVIERTQVPLNAGIFWLRVRIQAEGARDRIPKLVTIGPPAAMEVYWNGVLTASTGSPGNSRANEQGGNVNFMFELPLQMASAGEHVVAVRMSTYRTARFGERSAEFRLYAAPPEKFRALDARLNLLPAMAIGAMLTVAIATFVVWLLADRRLILILLSVLCTCAGLLVAVASAQFIWGYPAGWMYFLTLARIILVGVAGSLVLAITIVQLFPNCRRAWLLLPLAAEAAIAYLWLPLGMNPIIYVLWRATFLTAIALAGWAVLRRHESAWPLLAGMIGTYAIFEISPKHFAHVLFLIGFLPMLTGFIGAIALRVRRERIQARDTRMMAARLEIELLKKSLQPHFLMNTLTALSQVVEEKPAEAVQLIEDLAAEFRSLARFSGEK